MSCRAFRPPVTVLALAVAAATIGSGCAARHAVIAATGTNIGVEIAQSPASQTPHAKLGYQRTEVAVVPTNRSAHEDPGNVNGGAADTTDVLMELRFGGIFSQGENSGIYQRLAVGREAVHQPGADIMFSRDHAGKADAAVLQNLRELRSY